MLTVLMTRKKKRKREARKKEQTFGGYVYGTDYGNGLTSVYLSLNS